MESIRARSRTREAVHAEHREPTRATSKARSAITAKAINTIWERSGWTKATGSTGDVFTGFYRVIDQRSGRQREFAGRVVCTGRTCEAFIRNPPDSLLHRHPKQMCFRQWSGGWWRMNWYQATNDVDETITYLTQLVDEALNLYRD